jgi:DUF4097 and DUF4098 domain-containing protein YvlB
MSQGTESEHSLTFIRSCTQSTKRGGNLVFLAAIAMLAVLSGCGGSFGGDGSHKINGSIDVPAGKPPGAFATINGSIHVDDDAAVTSASTVNGGVKLGDHATASSLTTVNGSVTLGRGAHVSGHVSSVNGALSLEDGADVTGALSNVNGEIALIGAHVGGGINTVNGGMNIGGASRVEGGILVEKSNGGHMQIFHDVPRIVIGPGATVQGDLRFEHTVELFVSDKATVGAVTGAAPISFTGDAPPK